MINKYNTKLYAQIVVEMTFRDLSRRHDLATGYSSIELVMSEVLKISGRKWLELTT